MRKKTKEEFIKEAKEIHNNKYDYSQTEYINATTKVKIICPKHGVFEMTPHNHLNGQGCKKCGHLRADKKNSSTTEQFIKKANLIHSNKYNYSKVEYINNETKVKIFCPKHGLFEQTPQRHLKGSGCPECAKIRIGDRQRKTTEQFINEANKIHGNKYNYSQTEYFGCFANIKIICPKHGVFEQKPNNHLRGGGCPKCNSSHGEEKIRNYLLENNIIFEEQKRFKELIKAPFDFYLPEKNLLIEYNGIQHYKSVEYFGGKERLIKQQKTDKLKRQFAKENNIKLLTIKFDEDISKKLKLI